LSLILVKKQAAMIYNKFLECMFAMVKGGGFMRLADLQKFVCQKFGLRFQPVRPGTSNLQVLRAPSTNAWFAALSRFHVKQASVWSLDLKCGQFASTLRDLPNFTDAYRLNDPAWVGVLLHSGDEQAIKQALTYAFNLAAEQKSSSQASQFFLLPAAYAADDYQAQSLNFKQRNFKPHQQDIPEQIQRMQAAYDYSLLPAKGRAKNFYQQGKLMADYQDDFDQPVSCLRYYPVYHYLNTQQLRTYFTWRTKLRQGQLTACSLSYAYLYLYELLNNIGVDVQTGYQQLTWFAHKAAGKFDDKLQTRLQTWQQDYVLYYQLTDQLSIFASQREQDERYQCLLKHEQAANQDIAAALLALGNYRFLPKIAARPNFSDMLAAVWRQVRQTDFFFQKIGRKLVTQHRLFAGAIFYDRKQANWSMKLDPERSYHGTGLDGYLISIQPNSRQRQNINLLLHEIDRLLRQFWQVGRPLKARPLAGIYLQAVVRGIKEYHRQQASIKLDFSQLDQIRSDAAVTRERLLTDEEKAEELVPKPIPQPQPTIVKTYGLSPAELQFLLALLQHQPWKQQLREEHLMPTLAADQINAKLFDEIGDNVIEFDNQNQPRIISYYQSDLEQIFVKEH
jgi:predicted DNA-binding protein (MmcQ/YjbR family)